MVQIMRMLNRQLDAILWYVPSSNLTTIICINFLFSTEPGSYISKCVIKESDRLSARKAAQTSMVIIYSVLFNFNNWTLLGQLICKPIILLVLQLELFM